MIETPQSFATRTECEKAFHQNGFRQYLTEKEGWLGARSTSAQGTVWLAHEPQNGWWLALDHPGVIAELPLPRGAMNGPGLIRYQFEDLSSLYSVLPRVYALSASLPDAPLTAFRIRTAALPQTTEVERRVVQRIGQDIFRGSLMTYWQGRCPLTGISDPALLRASHIKPWKDCESDAERLDVHNGLLLSALWDAAFDSGLVSFGGDGVPMFSPKLSDDAKSQLYWQKPLSLNDRHREKLAWHRAAFLFGTD